MNLPRIRTFSHHCRERYGQTVGKIPLDLGIPCPNRSQGGCLYCRPASFTPFSLRTADSLAEQIRRGKQYLLRGRFSRYFAYLQQETPTAMATDRLMPLLAKVLKDADCLGLILSTRPDAIAADLPEALAKLVKCCGKQCLIELGLQSIHPASLELLNRNHSYGDFLDAVRRIQAAGTLQIGVHLILGIPSETKAQMLATIRTVGNLGIQAIKLHHLQVIRETALHTLYDQGRVPVLTLAGYLELLLELLPHIPADITIHRLWSTAHPDLLVAPRWQSLTGPLSQQLHRLMEERNLWQGQLADAGCGLPKERG
ncbi:MAG: TIGR01212 family radical SAM protein [Desulfobulbaceae bacterium]|nr:TIGR01212 family radical SAM protein [Desulfobulbaceae bacterium]